MGGGVKCSAVHAAAVATDETLGAGEHFLRGAPGKCEEKNAVGRDSAIDEMRDTINERAGLSCSRSGDNEEGSVAVSRRFCLLGIQLGGKIACLRGLNVSFACWVNDRFHHKL